MAHSRKPRSDSRARFEAELEPEGGPIDRLQSLLDERLAVQHEKSDDDDEGGGDLARPPGGPAPETPGAADGGAGPLGAQRTERIAEYRARQSKKLEAAEGPDIEEAPAPPPQNNWIPIGPSVVLKGQVSNRAN